MTAISVILYGNIPFYRAPDYVEATKRDFSATKALPPIYVWNTQSKIVRIAKEILSILIFPIWIYNKVHSLIGKYAGILPSSNLDMMKTNLEELKKTRLSLDLKGEWKYKRFTVEVDGYQVDATLMGKPSTLKNRRWVVYSGGNAEFCEHKMRDREFSVLLTGLNANGIVFNYPGVGSSSGEPSRKAMAKAYRAMLNLLEDTKNGIGAKTVVGVGRSIGGGVQGDALREHPIKKDIKYVFVKTVTFSDLASTAASLVHPIMDPLVKLVGWNLRSVESSKALTVPEITIQSANVDKPEELHDTEKLIDDGVIMSGDSLAMALLEDEECPKENKTFFGVPGSHNTPLNDPSFLVKKIKYYLAR